MGELSLPAKTAFEDLYLRSEIPCQSVHLSQRGGGTEPGSKTKCIRSSSSERDFAGSLEKLCCPQTADYDHGDSNFRSK